MSALFQQILVPIDFSPTSEDALNYAKQLATCVGGSLHLVHVIEDPLASGMWAAEIYVADFTASSLATREEDERRLRAYLSRDERKIFNVTFEVIVGRSPAHEIVTYARTNNMDLIVMGTHGRTGLSHVLIGSVAEQVVRTASCPVLTIRNQPGAVPETMPLSADASTPAA